MTDAVTTALENFQALMAGITDGHGGYPPESINQFPFSVGYIGEGEFSVIGGAWSEDFMDFIGQIHLTRHNLPQAIRMAMPYYVLFRNALANDPKLGGSIQTIHGQDQAVRFAFGRLEWTSNKGKPEIHIGWRFTVRVKIHGTIT